MTKDLMTVLDFLLETKAPPYKVQDALARLRAHSKDPAHEKVRPFPEGAYNPDNGA